MVEKKAYGKINLGLDIIGRREDGYHLVRMIMQSVDIFDILTFEKAEPEGEISITATNDPSLSLGEDNLIYKACRLLMDSYGIKEGVKVELTKNIPIAAGMAGGSSDCAAALEGMNELFGLGLSSEKLREIGVTLGADVPYCIMGGPAVSEGIGEVLTRLPELPEATFLIAKPVFGISTKEAYGAFDSIPSENVVHPDIDGMAEAIRKGDLSGVTDRLGNVLEQASISAHPEIEEIKKIMIENGAENALMSGSGPTVFGIFRDSEPGKGYEKAWKALEVLKDDYISELFVVGAAPLKN